MTVTVVKATPTMVLARGYEDNERTNINDSENKGGREGHNSDREHPQ